MAALDAEHYLATQDEAGEPDPSHAELPQEATTS